MNGDDHDEDDDDDDDDDDDAFIKERSRVIGLAIAARKQRFPEEQPYEYAPDIKAGENPVWDQSQLASLKDYNLMDLSI